LYVKLFKCQFWFEEVKLLGHVISKEGVLVDPTKEEVVIRWEPLKIVIEISSFLGLAGYCKIFIEGCSIIVMPLNQIIKNSMVILLNGQEKCENSLNNSRED